MCHNGHSGFKRGPTLGRDTSSANCSMSVAVPFSNDAVTTDEGEEGPPGFENENTMRRPFLSNATTLGYAGAA